MNESGLSGSGTPRDPDPKRRLFSSRRSAPPSLGDPRLEAVVSSSHQAIAERFEESLRMVADHALATMRQVAEEVWHATGTEVKDLQERMERSLEAQTEFAGKVREWLEAAAAAQTTFAADLARRVETAIA